MQMCRLSLICDHDKFGKSAVVHKCAVAEILEVFFYEPKKGVFLSFQEVNLINVIHHMSGK